jgi:hypothetical protein
MHDNAFTRLNRVVASKITFGNWAIVSLIELIG